MSKKQKRSVKECSSNTGPGAILFTTKMGVEIFLFNKKRTEEALVQFY